ncbi:hypothetical protein KC644_04350 [Candidatus Berkelbacteria bacterium]|nr:hypothetical protein [Candidatus Berkelbacteria bacterium]
MPYPDDLDDSACAWSSLYLFDSKSLKPEGLAIITKVLSAIEKMPGGPYRSWVVSPEAKEVWQDVDIAVNANVAYFLQLLEIELPNLNSYLDKALIEKGYHSQYYASEYPILYFLSRLNLKNSNLVIEYLESKVDSELVEGSVLKTALVANSLRNLNRWPSYQKVVNILAGLTIDEIKEEPFCLDPSLGGIKYFAGSKGLTASYVYRALTSNKVSSSTTRLSTYENVHRQVLINAWSKVDRGSLLGKELKLFSSIQSSKDVNREITTFPYWFATNFSRNNKFNEQVIRLCEASFWGWIAYTIFDDFLDEEGQTKQLPLACLAQRELTKIYDSFDNAQITFCFNRLMKEVDEANAYEVTSLRSTNHNPQKIVPDLASIASKSVGHLLGPLSFLIMARVDQAQIEMIERILRSYLVLKQLNDDLHDWEQDLQSGQINPVTSRLRVSTGVKASLIDLKMIFWKKIIDEFDYESEKIAKSAQKLINKQKVVKADFLTCLIDQFRGSIKRTVESKEESISFIKTFVK